MEKLKIFLNYVEKIFGFYLDSTNGFYLNHKFLLYTQKKGSKLTGISINKLNNNLLIRGKEHPQTNTVIHTTTQCQFKKNNSPEGYNYIKAFHNCLCDFFNEWDEFKNYELKQKGAKHTDFSPLFQYLKDIRDRLTHHLENPNNKPKEIKPLHLEYVNETLPGFKKGDSINLNERNLYNIVKELRFYLSTK